jgi:hypothetical protein
MGFREQFVGDTAMKFIDSAAPPYNADNAWNRILKRTIGRFVRGNIAAQNNRIMLPEEQKKNHERARRIAVSWRGRGKTT